ncbi:glycosyl hydrolase 115 family protein [Antarcticibacterium sp. 1MA-6-2]|uniref:glycosyl hydrolase 115 family protein n=1 Tax=Antarcticibacterium sp. 1MA-6-2 TaxID=2908210 RepID=UPI002105BE79|nr:glycosyl hydrolase 115 family protein [Antarcticibacterium sp. 1MA-6-2]
MRVPDDVTLLLADDNWGNIRKLPNPEEASRKGGYGIYYHFDYVGGPRNYKWLNTTQISRVWEQMNLAYKFGADKLWIVNVGDIKPMEYPTSFFLDFAWDPEKIGAGDLKEYTQNWAARQLGKEFSKEIADILLTYTKYNSRRKPELISPGTYSLSNFNEAERVVKEYNELVEKAEAIYRQIQKKYRDAYFQLVLFPVKASANLNELYVSAAKNKLYAAQGRAAANIYAAKTKELFEKDAELTNQYHTELA